jgi:D-alanine-D-alanine ligase
MIVHDDVIYVLETNTIPGMTPVSLFPLAAKTAGISFTNLLDRLIELALDEVSP